MFWRVCHGLFKCSTSWNACTQHQEIEEPTRTWIFQRVLNGWQMVPIYHPLGFKQHPLEDAGICLFLFQSSLLDVFSKSRTRGDTPLSRFAKKTKQLPIVSGWFQLGWHLTNLALLWVLWAAGSGVLWEPDQCPEVCQILQFLESLRPVNCCNLLQPEVWRKIPTIVSAGEKRHWLLTKIPWKWWLKDVERLFSFWNGPFLGDCLVDFICIP